WELNGYAIQLGAGTVLIDPPAPENDDWAGFDALKPIVNIVVTNRDHVRDAALFRTRYGRDADTPVRKPVREAALFQRRYGASLVAGADEVAQLAPVAIDETVREGDRIAGALLVIHLPGKSPGEIGLFMDRTVSAVSGDLGGILILGDAIIGHPPGSLGLIPE